MSSERSARSRHRAILVLTGLGLAAAAILATLDHFTHEPIALERERRALAALTAVLPADSFDNELVTDFIEIGIDGLAMPARIYRARLAGQPVAAVYDVTTDRGYSGSIRLLAAIDPDATLIAVRVLEHRETPGLGDRIEVERSNWIRQFSGRSLDDPPRQRWAPDRRGGDFYTLSNATITAGAVIEAVRRNLEHFEVLGESVWSDPEDTEHD